jgi:hypothetical protein
MLGMMVGERNSASALFSELRISLGDSLRLLFPDHALEMIHHAGMAFATAHQDPELATEANVVAIQLVGRLGPAVVAVVGEEYSRPSSHILYLVAAAG